MRQIVLLRGINLGPRNRIAMPALREVLADACVEDVRTYLQSGNIVLSSDLAPARLARECRRVLTDAFDLDIETLVRTRDELAEVVARNPLGQVAINPKRYQVTFLSAELERRELEVLNSLAAREERVAAVGREVYAWHPDGIARSKLAVRLGGRGLAVTATSRNWATVTALLRMADA